MRDNMLCSSRALLLLVFDTHAEVVLGILFPVARSELNFDLERRHGAWK